jgi:hypothetical protein
MRKGPRDQPLTPYRLECGAINIALEFQLHAQSALGAQLFSPDEATESGKA